MSSPALQVLHSVFGFRDFRGQQQAVIEHVIAGGDALVLMPTGGGKSLCYQVPALVRQGTAVVVSPLIALMEDQVAALRQHGVAAAYLNSSMDPASQRAVEARLLAGELSLLYVAPERLLGGRCLGLLERVEVSLFAIDEAHCVSQWGHDFRPEYRQLSVLHERFPQVPRIALTATADTPTRAEIVERLALGQAREFVSSFDRPNIHYQVVEKDRPRVQLLDFLGQHRNDSGIVYCLSRRKVDDTAQWLCAQGFHALAYHAGMSADERARNQHRFLREEGVVMVATIAFGMGIDKPDVRFVAHLDLPRSVEGYYQETGRAGRDGLPARAWMTYGLSDVVTQSRFIVDSDAGEERKRLERSKLDALLSYAETTTCRRRQLLAWLGEQMDDDCGNCDNCIDPPPLHDATVAAQKALSCVYRSGQRFGVGHLIDVLRGSNKERVRELGHDRLSTYGIGKELDQRQWSSLFRHLVVAGYLVPDDGGYGTLRLTPRSGEVLRGEVTVQLRHVRQQAASRPRSSVALSDEQLPLWERLRATRKRLADEQKAPAFIIFNDATLLAMLEAQPRTLDQMAAVPGVGQVKLERYGEAFLAALEAETALADT